MRSIIVVLVGLVLISEASARIGETEDQCVVRYGKATKCDNTTSPAAKCCVYQAGRFEIKAYFVDGRAAALLVSTRGPRFSQEEIGVLLSTNSDGSAWKKRPTWSENVQEYDRADGRAWLTIAAGDAMLIESIEWRAAKTGMGKF